VRARGAPLAALSLTVVALGLVWGLASAGAPAPTRGPAATTSCGARDVSVRALPISGGSTHVGVLLRYTNTGPVTCWIRGYPRLTLETTARPEAATDRPEFYLGGLMGRSGVAPLSAQPRATLRPRASAYSLIGDDDGPARDNGLCPTATSARVVVTHLSAAGSTTVDTLVTVPRIYACLARPLVTPIVPFVAQSIDDSFVAHSPGTYYLR
jgi:Domain of unknown function (DUF4232)